MKFGMLQIHYVMEKIAAKEKMGFTPNCKKKNHSIHFQSQDMVISEQCPPLLVDNRIIFFFFWFFFSIFDKVNLSSEKVSRLGIMPNMIFYLMNWYHIQAPTRYTILFIWSALISNSLAFSGALLPYINKYFKLFLKGHNLIETLLPYVKKRGRRKKGLN